MATHWLLGMATQFRTSSKRLESIAQSTFLTQITRSYSSLYLAISQSCFDCIILTMSGAKMGSRSENGVISKLGRFAPAVRELSRKIEKRVYRNECQMLGRFRFLLT